MKNLILVINPGSTSTKVSLFNSEEKVEVKTKIIRHTTEEIDVFNRIADQKNFRKNVLLAFLEEQQISVDQLQAVVGRGGLLKPIPGGTYLVTENMLNELIDEKYNSHASNLGAILAYEIAKIAGINAYIVDPVVVDEIQDIARISGLKGIERRSVSHALNQKAVARKLLKNTGKDYNSSNVIVAHIGGGISIAAHQQGQMIDVVNALDGEGPFTPERTGELPAHDFAKYILSNQLSLEEVKQYIAGKGGLKSYLNETDIRIIEKRIYEGDEEAENYLEGMCYQIAKAIGECAVVLKGQVNMIILTGGGAFSDFVTNTIDKYVKWIAPVQIFPGEMEMEALFNGVLRVINEEENAKIYSNLV